MVEDVLAASSDQKQAEGAAVAAISMVPAAASLGLAGAVGLSDGPKHLQRQVASEIPH